MRRNIHQCVGGRHSAYCDRAYAAWLRARERTVRRRRKPTVKRGNPPGAGRLVYSEGRIVGSFYGKHAEDGKWYRHRFTHDRISVYALADGSLKLVPHHGRLWGHY